MKKNKNIQRSWTAVTYPQDFCEHGAALGPQTILRLQKLVDTQKQGRFQISHVVLACGIGPDTQEYPQQVKSFAVMMKDWLVAEGTFDANVIHCSKNDNVWNCIEVTIEMIRVIRGFNLSRNILVVSTGFHLYPRMWVTWKLICRRKHCWNVAFVPAWKGTYSIVHELLGTVKYIPIALWYRFNDKV
ncbi:MAG: hypothetical protein WCQ60_00415 [bacterium]